MVVGDEGQFRFTNGTAVEKDLGSDRKNAVVNHEFVHSQLYSMTTYGQIVLMLEKNSWLHNRSKEFLEVLFKYIRRMQERTAVNVEIIYECIDNGLKAYNDAIEKLKSRNRTYYNYFRKLCCINCKINSEDEAEMMQGVIITIARIALNVNPELIPLNEINDAKRLKIYFDNPENSSLISPNKRFDILVNYLFRENDNNSDIESVIKGSIDFEKMDDFDYIHKVAFQKVSNILSDSQISSRLIARITTIGVMKIKIEEGGEYLTAKPAQINVNKEITIKPVENKKKLYELLNKQDYKELFVLHTIGGFEEIHVVCVYGQIGVKKMVYPLYITNEEDFYNIISNTVCKMVFYKTKLMDKEAKRIRKMVRQLPIYIFDDTPIINIIQFIKSFFFKGRFGFIEYENYYIFAVSKKSIILFADVFKEAKSVLINELCANGLSYTENADEICNINEVIRLNRICNEYEVNRLEDAKFEK